MMVIIHGLPINTKFQDLRAVIQEECNISDIILDSFIPEGNGLKKIRVGLANDNEGNQVIQYLNGYCFSGHILQVMSVGNLRDVQSRHQNAFPMDNSSVSPWNNQLLESVLELQQVNQYTYQQGVANQPALSQYEKRISVFDRIGPPIQDFVTAQKTFPQQVVAPTMAPEQEQMQWSANVGTYQNNVPFYQQQTFKSPGDSTFTLDDYSSSSRSRRRDIQHENISYPEKTTQPGSIDKQYNWFPGCTLPVSRDGRPNRYGTVDKGDRDSKFANRYSTVDKGDRDSKFANRSDNRERDGNRSRDENPVRNANRHPDRNRDRDENRGRDVNRDRAGNRVRDENLGRDPYRDRNEKRDRDASRDRNNVRHKNDRPAFSYHDSARNLSDSKLDAINSRESRLDTHIRNQRMLVSNNTCDALPLKRGRFENSRPQTNRNVSVQKEFKNDRQTNRPSNTSTRSNERLPPEPSRFDNMKTNEIKNDDRRKRPPVDEATQQDTTLKRKHVEQDKPSTQDRKRKRSPLQVPPKKLLKPTATVTKDVKADLQKFRVKRYNRHTTWVHQVASSEAAQVFESVGKSTSDNRKIFTDMKKRIVNRINMIYGFKLADTHEDVLDEYKKNFATENSHQFYNAIQSISENKIKWEKSSGKVMSEPALVETDAHVSAKMSNAPGNESASSMPPRTLHSSDLVALNKKTTPGGGNGKTLKKRAPPREAADIKLPKFLVGDQNNIQKHGVMLDLSEPYKSILNQYLKPITSMASECCHEVDNELGVSNETLWNRAVSEISQLMRMHVTNRILNLSNALLVRIFYNTKMPQYELLEAFLKKYDVVSKMKLQRKKLLVVRCGTFKGFDDLCRLKTTVIGDVQLTFKPLQVARYPRVLKTGRMVVNKSDFECDVDKLSEDIADCQRDILNDSDIICTEKEDVIIDLDETVSISDGIASTIDETFKQNPGLNNETIEINKRDDINTENESKDCVNTEFKEIIDVTADNLGIDNKAKKSADKCASQSLIVDDHCYVVLDDGNDKESEEVTNTEDENKDSVKTEFKEVIDVTDDNLGLENKDGKTDDKCVLPSLIVDDHCYVVLDDGNDKESDEVTNTEDVIDEDDLEDF